MPLGLRPDHTALLISCTIPMDVLITMHTTTQVTPHKAATVMMSPSFVVFRILSKSFRQRRNMTQHQKTPNTMARASTNTPKPVIMLDPSDVAGVQLGGIPGGASMPCPRAAGPSLPLT